MPSSTFSFNRAPGAPPRTTFIIAMICAGFFLGGIELHLRSYHGHPSLPLSKSRYAANLEQGLANPDRLTTLLLGASRMRSAFSSRVFEEHTGQAPLYYLATSGESPLALIFYLAEETTYSGKLIVSLSASSLSENAAKDQRYIVNYFEDEWNWNQKTNHWFGDHIASRFVLRQENYSVANGIKSVILRKYLPGVPYWRRHAPNGESFYDFSLVRDQSLLSPPPLKNMGVPTKNPVWEQRLSRLKHAVLQLRKRGCQIAFVRFPMSGNWWANNQKRWPRGRYWDRIATVAGSITIHFQDIPAMRSFHLPDNSHIDKRDRDAFTRVLLGALASRGMIWER